MKFNSANIIVTSFVLLLTVTCSATANTDPSNTSSANTPLPKEAIDTCGNLKEGDSCNFVKDNTKQSGVCQKGQDNKLGCIVKNDASTQGGSNSSTSGKY